MCLQSLTFRLVLSMNLWLGDSVQIDSLLLAWEFREEFNNVQQGMLFVIGQVCHGFSPLV